MHAARGRGRLLQRHRTLDNLRPSLDGSGTSAQNRNSQLFSWDDEFWKRSSKKGALSLASSASTFEEVESLCLSKSSSESMNANYALWDKFSSNVPWKTPSSSSRKLMSRQSSTSSTSTSRSSGGVGEAAGTEPMSENNSRNEQCITDSLLESMEFLDAHGNLDPTDKFYLEKIFQRVLNWNNGMSMRAKIASSADRRYQEVKHLRRSVADGFGHQDANSPQSHAMLRKKLEKLKQSEKYGSHRQVTSEIKAAHEANFPGKRRFRDMFVPDEDEILTEPPKYYQPTNSARQRKGITRQISHSSRDTSSSSKPFSDHSTGQLSIMSSMSSLSMDNSSLRGSPQQSQTVQPPTSQQTLPTFLPTHPMKPAASFEFAPTPDPSYLFSQPYTTSHAERVLMGLGFGAAEGFIPERFLKDWYTKIAKAQMESQMTPTSELKHSSSCDAPSVTLNTTGNRDLSSPQLKSSHNKQSLPNTSQDYSSSFGSCDASKSLPISNHYDSKMERLREYIADYSSNTTSIDDARDIRTKQRDFSRQKSLPVGLETLTKREQGRARKNVMDPQEKEFNHQVIMTDVDSNSRSKFEARQRSNGIEKELLKSLYNRSVYNHQNDRNHTKSSYKDQNSEYESEEKITKHFQEDANKNSKPLESNKKSNINNNSRRSPQRFIDADYIQVDSKVKVPNVQQKNENQYYIRGQKSPSRQTAIDAGETVGKGEPTPSHNKNNKQTSLNKEVIDNEKGQTTSTGYLSKPMKTNSTLSKDSLEVADIMQNQPNRNSHLNQRESIRSSDSSRKLKSAMKHVEPAMVSIVLEDTEKNDGWCNADLVAVSQEGIHLVIPLSSCNPLNLSPIPQSPVTVIEVSLDNQQDSLDTEGTSSSKDADDDYYLHNFTNSQPGDHALHKLKHGRRSSLSCLSPHQPEHFQRRRSTGIISPIPCQLTFSQLPEKGKDGHSRRRLSLDIPGLPEIRKMLEKQKNLKENERKETLECPKKTSEKRRASFSEAVPIIITDVLPKESFPRQRPSLEVPEISEFRYVLEKPKTVKSNSYEHKSGRERRRASFSDAEPIIINDVLSKERSLSSRYGRRSISPFRSSPRHAEADAAVNNIRLITPIDEISCSSDNQGTDSGDKSTHLDPVQKQSTHNNNQCSAGIQHESNTKNYKCNIKDAHSFCASKNCKPSPEVKINTIRSNESSPGSSRSAFRAAIKRSPENSPSPCTGYFSETDLEEFPTHINIDLKPRPISSIAKNLEGQNSDNEGDIYLGVANKSVKASFPTLKFSDQGFNFCEQIHSGKVKTQMISRAVEVNDSTSPYVRFAGKQNPPHQISSDFYYACDRGVQCDLAQANIETKKLLGVDIFNKFTQTDVTKFEISCQTTDTFFLVERNFNQTAKPACQTLSKAVNTVVCFNKMEASRIPLSCVPPYSDSTDYKNIDKTIQEIEAEISYIDKKNSQDLLTDFNKQSNFKRFNTTNSQKIYPIKKFLESRPLSTYFTGKDNVNKWLPRREERVNTRTAPSSWEDAIGLVDIKKNLTPRGYTIHERTISNKTEIFNEFTNAALNYIPWQETERYFVDTESKLTHNNSKECTNYYGQHDFKEKMKFMPKNERRSYRKFSSSSGCVPYTVPHFKHSINHTDLSQMQRGILYSYAKKVDKSNKMPSQYYRYLDYSKSRARKLDSDNSMGSYSQNQHSNKENLLFGSELATLHKSAKALVDKLANTEFQALPMTRNTSKLLLPLSQKESDRGHSKLSRLKYKLASHQSSCSSLEIEQDFKNASESSLGLSSSLKPISPSTREYNLMPKNVQDFKELSDVLSLSEHTNNKGELIDPINEGLSKEKFKNSYNKSNPDEQSLIISALGKEFAEKQDRSEDVSKKDDDVNCLVNKNSTDNTLFSVIIKTSSQETDYLTSKKPCLPSLSKIISEISDTTRSTPEIVISPIKVFQYDFLQVPGSPDHIFKKARLPLKLESPKSTPTTSSPISPKIPSDDGLPSITEYKANLEYRSSTENHVFNYPLMEQTVTLFDHFSESPKKNSNSFNIVEPSAPIDIKISEDTEGRNTQKVYMGSSKPTASQIGSLTDLSYLGSVECSIDEFSEASLYPRLSNDSVLEGEHCNESGLHSKNSINKIVAINNVEVGNFNKIATPPEVFDPDVFKFSHKIQRSQSVGGVPYTTGRNESVDVVSNKSVDGSDDDRDVDDMDVLVEESRRLRLNSESSYSEPLLDMTDSLSDEDNRDGKNSDAPLCLLTAGKNQDDLLQVSDFGGLSPTLSQTVTRSIEHFAQSPHNKLEDESLSVSRRPRTLLRDLPCGSARIDNDSDDELDSDTELKIREKLRQSRRGSRRNSKDNWDVVQAVLQEQRRDFSDVKIQEDIEINLLTKTNSLVVGYDTQIHKIFTNTDSRVDNSYEEECDDEISNINMKRPTMKRLIKMYSDPVDKNIYCNSIHIKCAKDSTANLSQNTSLMEETLHEEENEYGNRDEKILNSFDEGVFYKENVSNTPSEDVSNSKHLINISSESASNTENFVNTDHAGNVTNKDVLKMSSDNVSNTKTIFQTSSDNVYNTENVLKTSNDNLSNAKNASKMSSVGVFKEENVSKIPSDKRFTTDKNTNNASEIRSTASDIISTTKESADNDDNGLNALSINTQENAYNTQERNTYLASQAFSVFLNAELEVLDKTLSSKDHSQLITKEERTDESFLNKEKNKDDNKHKYDDGAARVLAVEIGDDDVDNDTLLTEDRQDIPHKKANDIFDELEMIALFRKIDSFDKTRNFFIDYSSESLSSSDFKLSQISEEETQSEENMSDSGRKHLWQVRNRFVTPQDTQDTTVECSTREVNTCSRTSENSFNENVRENINGETSANHNANKHRSTEDNTREENTCFLTSENSYINSVGDYLNGELSSNHNKDLEAKINDSYNMNTKYETNDVFPIKETEANQRNESFFKKDILNIISTDQYQSSVNRLSELSYIQSEQEVARNNDSIIEDSSSNVYAKVEKSVNEPKKNSFFQKFPGHLWLNGKVTLNTDEMETSTFNLQTINNAEVESDLGSISQKPGDLSGNRDLSSSHPESTIKSKDPKETEPLTYNTCILETTKNNLDSVTTKRTTSPTKNMVHVQRDNKNDEKCNARGESSNTSTAVFMIRDYMGARKEENAGAICVTSDLEVEKESISQKTDFTSTTKIKKGIESSSKQDPNIDFIERLKSCIESRKRLEKGIELFSKLEVTNCQEKYTESSGKIKSANCIQKDTDCLSCKFDTKTVSICKQEANTESLVRLDYDIKSTSSLQKEIEFSNVLDANTESTTKIAANTESRAKKAAKSVITSNEAGKTESTCNVLVNTEHPGKLQADTKSIFTTSVSTGTFKTILDVNEFITKGRNNNFVNVQIGKQTSSNSDYMDNCNDVRREIGNLEPHEVNVESSSINNKVNERNSTGSLPNSCDTRAKKYVKDSLRSMFFLDCKENDNFSKRVAKFDNTFMLERSSKLDKCSENLNTAHETIFLDSPSQSEIHLNLKQNRNAEMLQNVKENVRLMFLLHGVRPEDKKTEGSQTVNLSSETWYNISDVKEVASKPNVLVNRDTLRKKARAMYLLDNEMSSDCILTDSLVTSNDSTQTNNNVVTSFKTVSHNGDCSFRDIIWTNDVLLRPIEETIERNNNNIHQAQVIYEGNDSSSEVIKTLNPKNDTFGQSNVTFKQNNNTQVCLTGGSSLKIMNTNNVCDYGEKPMNVNKLTTCALGMDDLKGEEEWSKFLLESVGSSQSLEETKGLDGEEGQVTQIGILRNIHSQVITADTLQECPHKITTPDTLQEYHHEIITSDTLQEYPHKIITSDTFQEYHREISIPDTTQEYSSKITPPNTLQEIPSQITTLNTLQEFPSKITTQDTLEDFPNEVATGDIIQEFPPKVNKPNAIKYLTKTNIPFNETPHTLDSESLSSSSEEGTIESPEGSLSTVVTVRNCDSSIEQLSIEGSHSNSFIHDSWSGDSNSSQTSTKDEDVVDDIKLRVRTMLLMNQRSQLNKLKSIKALPSAGLSSLETSIENSVSHRVKVTTMCSESRHSLPSSFFTSISLDNDDTKQERSYYYTEQMKAKNMQNIRTLVYNEDNKYISSVDDKKGGTNVRNYRGRDSLLKLHQQDRVSSSNGSDGDPDLTTALRNQGDFDIRCRDLALGRISSDNNDEEDLGLSRDSFKRLPSFKVDREMATSSSVSCITKEDDLNDHNLYTNMQENNAFASKVIKRDLNLSQANQDYLKSEKPKAAVGMQQTDEKNDDIISSLQTKNVQCLMEDLGENLQDEEKTETISDSQENGNSSALTSSSYTSFLAKKRASNFQIQETVASPTHIMNSADHHEQCNTLRSGLHPELSYLDIVSKLMQQSETIDYSLSHTGLDDHAISPANNKPKNPSSKSVKFATRTNIISYPVGETTEECPQTNNESLVSAELGVCEPEKLSQYRKI